MSPDLAASLKARLLAAAKRQKEEFERTLGLRNSRMKDFHDVWALARALPFDGNALQRSIAACFERRGTPLASEAPDPLTPSFYAQPELVDRWASYLVGSRPTVTPPASFAVLGGEVIRFLGPVQSALLTPTGFDARWAPGGPWRR